MDVFESPKKINVYFHSFNEITYKQVIDKTFDLFGKFPNSNEFNEFNESNGLTYFNRNNSNELEMMSILYYNIVNNLLNDHVSSTSLDEPDYTNLMIMFPLIKKLFKSCANLNIVLNPTIVYEGMNKEKHFISMAFIKIKAMWSCEFAQDITAFSRPEIDVFNELSEGLAETENFEFLNLPEPVGENFQYFVHSITLTQTMIDPTNLEPKKGILLRYAAKAIPNNK